MTILSFLNRHAFRAVLLALCLWGLGLEQAWAYYSIAPLRLEVQVPEKQSVATTSVRVTNNGEESVRLKVYMQDWTVNANGGLVIMPDPVPGSIIGFTRFNPKEFEISPNSVQVLRMAIAFPPDTPDGEYHSMIFFEDLKPAVQRLTAAGGYSTALEVKQRFGSAIYVYKGQVKPQPVLDRFECKTEQGKLKTLIDFDNTGEKHARLAASIVVMRQENGNKWKPVREIPVRNLQDIVVMPHQKYAIEQILAPTHDTDPLPPGHYQLTLHVMSRNDKSAKELQSQTELDIEEPTAVTEPPATVIPTSEDPVEPTPSAEASPAQVAPSAITETSPESAVK